MLKGLWSCTRFRKICKKLTEGGGQNSPPPSTPAGIGLKGIGFQIYYDKL